MTERSAGLARGQLLGHEEGDRAALRLLSGQAAGRGEPWNREQLLDLAGRKVTAYVRAVDFGIDAVTDLPRAEQELRGLETAGGDARA
ncbi:hypothetical protein BX265_0356 [Streptomyces sp. TLI_235]|nr:hypothetical protein [Streptomyces sp. TLI_235]PBC75682.1 hypothetical protein BX265_0356 [Streptomyces sp. TLI_235]